MRGNGWQAKQRTGDVAVSPPFLCGLTTQKMERKDRNVSAHEHNRVANLDLARRTDCSKHAEVVVMVLGGSP